MTWHHTVQKPLTANQIVLLNFHTSTNHSFFISFHFSCHSSLLLFFLSSSIASQSRQRCHPCDPDVRMSRQLLKGGQPSAHHLSLSFPLILPLACLLACLPSYLHACIHSFTLFPDLPAVDKSACVTRPTAPYWLPPLLPSFLSLLYVLYILYCHFRLLSRTETLPSLKKKERK